MIVARADGELVAISKEARLVRRLQSDTPAIGILARAINRTVVSGRIEVDCAIRIDARSCRIGKCQTVFNAQKTRRVIALLSLGDIAVNVLLLEPAVVGVAGDRQRVGRLDRTVELIELERIIRRLRRREGAIPAAFCKQFFRSCCRHADMVVRAGEIEVKFRPGVLETEIQVSAAHFSIGEIAEAVVIDGFERAVDPEVADLLTGLS